VISFIFYVFIYKPTAETSATSKAASAATLSNNVRCAHQQQEEDCFPIMGIHHDYLDLLAAKKSKL
jgi:hypothetical protein